MSADATNQHKAQQQQQQINDNKFIGQVSLTNELSFRFHKFGSLVMSILAVELRSRAHSIVMAKLSSKFFIPTAFFSVNDLRISANHEIRFSYYEM